MIHDIITGPGMAQREQMRKVYVSARLIVEDDENGKSTTQIWVLGSA